MQTQQTQPLIVTNDPTIAAHKIPRRVALFTEDGEPIDLSGGGGSVDSVIFVLAGSNLAMARPASSPVVYWVFNDSAVNVGASGENIVNGEPGDLWFVPDA